MSSVNRVVAGRKVYLGMLLDDIVTLRKASGMEELLLPIHFVVMLQTAHLHDREYAYTKRCLQMARDEAAANYRARAQRVMQDGVWQRSQILLEGK